MISVCLATYNGEKYVGEQLSSILNQLKEEDEVVVSDDCSTDKTLQIIRSFNDPRVRIFEGARFGSPIFNFENALKYATGDFIFLSDQDDIWLKNKVEVMVSHLQRYDVVVSDCYVVNKELQVIQDSFYSEVVNKNGFFKNLLKNYYLGCCMAFRREILTVVIPFPKNIAMHDIWIGLCTEAFYNSVFIDEKLILYRRHGQNASNTSEKSSKNRFYRIYYRLQFLYNIIDLKFKLSNKKK